MTDKNQENKRLFFGLDFSEEDKSKIFNWLTSKVESKRKPILKSNLHLTLAFLPNVPIKTQEALIEFARSLSVSPFSLRFEETSFWQNSGIFYLKPTSQPSSLTQLANTLRDEGEKLQLYTNPFAYHPHVTLIRNCKQPPQIIQKITPFDVTYSEFKLFHSTRINNLLRYIPIETFPLKAD
mgnify:FL=1